GNATSPIIFSAGTLCANLFLQLQTKARNQFYLISLPYEANEKLGLVGVVHAWDWAYGEGWAPAASSNSGLPALCAFGYRAEPRIIARQIAQLMVTDKIDWSEVISQLPEVAYILPQDLANLER